MFQGFQAFAEEDAPPLEGLIQLLCSIDRGGGHRGARRARTKVDHLPLPLPGGAAGALSAAVWMEELRRRPRGRRARRRRYSVATATATATAEPQQTENRPPGRRWGVGGGEADGGTWIPVGQTN